ncbi:uncharacterized protein [Typha angustifolia]|uniref:uncharacterized protein n=1 Tax=Typha angustifolia TaxID=59011 RepID=UPI003C2FB5EC
MQQPLSSTALPPTSSPSPPPPPSLLPKDNNNKREKKKLPTAEEVLSHYESQGLDTREASLKAIGELQSLLYKSFTSASSSSSLSRKLDNVNTRLAIVESKLDSKPDFPQSFAIALSSGALLHAFSSIWDSVKSATRGSPPPL